MEDAVSTGAVTEVGHDERTLLIVRSEGQPIPRDAALGEPLDPLTRAFRLIESGKGETDDREVPSRAIDWCKKQRN